MSAAAAQPAQTKTKAWDALRIACAVSIGTLIMLRAVVFFAPRVVFDVDPTLDLNPIVGLGPAESMAIDAVLLALCALGLFAEVCSGRKVELLLLLLGLGGLPMVFWHGYDDLGNLWRGVSWAAAIVSAVTIAHLARDRHLRIVVLALLAAAIAYVLVRGLSQLFYEHAQTMANFRKTRASFFAAQGWEPNSAQAQLYERRLDQNNPAGWFITTNLLGTFAAAAMALWLGIANGLWRHYGWRAAIGSIIALLAFFGVAAFELYTTDSKGALAAGALGLAIVLVANFLISMRKRWTPGETSAKRLATLGSAAFIALMLLAVAAIAVRGTLLPESALGDKSLLFRWFYMDASIDIAHEHLVAGVGPDKFQEQFVRFRPPRCPEEVTSAHNVMLDWVVSLGAFGWVWIGLLFVFAARAGGRLLTRDDAPPEEADAAALTASRTWLALIATAVLVGLGASFVVESPGINSFPLQLWRGAGIVLSLLVALLTMRSAALVSRATLALSLAAAAAVVLVHSQIEMTMTQPASAGLALLLLALAAPAKPGKRQRSAIPIALLLIGLAIWLTMFAVVPAWKQQKKMIDAAHLLAPIAGDVRPTSAQVVEARTQCANALRRAFDVLPTNPDPPFYAARQFKMAADAAPDSDRGALLQSAIGMAALSIDTVSLPSYHALMAVLNSELAHTPGNEDVWLDAIGHAQQLTRLDPNGLSAWRLYADLCWQWHRHDLALQAYERTLEINANMALDELKQLTPVELSEIERRLAELRANEEAG